MRACVRLSTFLVLILFSGCANIQLKHSTINQASTLTDLQHKQVLNNLAAVACNPAALPFHVNLHDGTTSVTDNGSILAQVISASSLTLGAQRSIVDQWSMTPVTDDATLKLLQIAYRRALGSPEDLYTNDLANDLAHEFKKQTGVVDDLRTLNQLGALASSDLTREESETVKKSYKSDASPEIRSEAAALQARLFSEKIVPPQQDRGYTAFEIRDAVKLSDSIISTNDDRIIQEHERLTDKNLLFPPVIDPESGQAVVLMANGQTTLVPIDPQTGLPIQGTSVVPLYKKTTPTVAELRRQVKEINDDLLKISPGWVGVGCKKDRPKDACYVAHHTDCGRDCYVWVGPQGRQALEDFTLKVLKLSTLIKETQVLSVPGVRYTPGINGFGGGGGFSGLRK